MHIHESETTDILQAIGIDDVEGSLHERSLAEERDDSKKRNRYPTCVRCVQDACESATLLLCYVHVLACMFLLQPLHRPCVSICFRCPL